MTHHAQILWFAGCPNSATARTILHDVITRLALDTTGGGLSGVPDRAWVEEALRT